VTCWETRQNDRGAFKRTVYAPLCLCIVDNFNRSMVHRELRHGIPQKWLHIHRPLRTIIGVYSGLHAARLSGRALAASRYATRACAERLEFHHHHQVVQPVPAPTSQPRDMPIAEAGAQGDRCAEAQELGFEHCVDPRSAHSWLAGRMESSEYDSAWLRGCSLKKPTSMPIV
jgi:hypothetical protein